MGDSAQTISKNIAGRIAKRPGKALKKEFAWPFHNVLLSGKWSHYILT